MEQPWSNVCRRRRDMKSIREMKTDTETYRLEIKRLIEADPKARRIYNVMKAKLSAARQLRDLENKTRRSNSASRLLRT
jgi:hypothetical protein